MQRSDFPKSKGIIPIIYRIYFLLAIIQNLGALALILQVKSEESAHRLLGLSNTRLIIASVFLLFALLSITLLAETWFRRERFDKRVQLLIHFLNRQTAWGLTMIMVGGFFLLGTYFITLYPDITEPYVRGIFNRMLPTAIWIAGMSAQTFVSLAVMRYGVDLFKFRPRGATFYLVCAALGGMFLTWSLVMREIYTTESQLTGWNNMGVPIIETQLFIAWGAGIAMLVFAGLVSHNSDKVYWLRKLAPQKNDLLIAILIWLVTVILWQSVPITPSWFLSEPAFPNFQNYPTSDARAYDVVGQTALIGEGYFFIDAPIIKRPLHALYITLLRLIGGQDYDQVIFLQVLILAVFPALIYLLTRNLFNQVSGIMAAVIIMLREANSIAIAGTITASHVKLIMVDFPAAFVNLIFVFLTVRMLQQIKVNNLLALVTGASLGFSMLVRLEAFVFLFPLVLVTAILLFPEKQYSKWIRNTLLLLLGVLLVLVPWIWRNWKVTGIVYIDSPYFRYRLIAQRFQPVAETPAPSKEVPGIPAPVETPISFPTEIPTLPPTPIVSQSSTPVPTRASPPEEERVRVTLQQAISFIKQNPSQLISFFVAHYLNSQLQTILIMPSSYRTMESLTSLIAHRSSSRFWQECCSLENYVRKMPYWHKWDSKFPSQSVLPLFINSIVLAMGIHVAWKRHKVIGIVPLLYCITYLVFNSLFRNSGGRYVLPVDWIIVVYFGIGMAYITMWLIGSIFKTNLIERYSTGPIDSNPPSRSKTLLRSPEFYAMVIGIFLIASIIPFVEKSFPRLYNENRKQAMLKSLFDSSLLTEPQRLDMQNFIDRGGLVYAGRALYPLYYKANAGGIGDRSSPQSPKPYARLIFHLIGQYNSSLLMPVKEKPLAFPNASDVLVFMCPDKDVLAVAIYDKSESPQAIWMNSSYPEDITCPIPLPETEK